MANGITDYLEGNASITKEVIGDVCSITLEKVGVGSALVSPAIWVVSGERPDAVDVGLWATGLAGGLVGIAAMGTSVVKALVDDDVHRRVMAIRQVEGEPYSKFIESTLKYSYAAGDGINAMSVAAAGGTAWESHGIWVYIKDANGRLVCDYQPKIAKTIYGPLLPLRRTADGFRWHVRRG